MRTTKLRSMTMVALMLLAAFAPRPTAGEPVKSEPEKEKKPETMHVFFRDASDHGVRNARVTIVPNDPKTSLPQREFLTDDGSAIAMQRPNDGLSCRFDVDAGARGRAQSEEWSTSSGSQVVLPLVSPNTPQWDRAARGVVQDEQGRAVAGAAVRCSHVRTPGD